MPSGSEQQKIMEEKWFVARKRYVPCVWPVHTFWAWSVAKYFGVPTTGKVLSVWDRGDYTVVFDRHKTLINLGKAVAEQVLKKSKDFKSFRDAGIQAGENAVKFTKGFASKSDSATVEEYISFLDAFTIEYAKIMRDNMHYWVMGTPAIEKMLRSELGSYSHEETDKIFAIMSAPIEQSYSGKLDSELNRLISQAKTAGLSSIQNAIDNFVSKYFWFPYEYVGPNIWDKEKVTALINERLASASEIHSAPAGDMAAQEKCIAEYALSPRVVELFTAIQHLTLLSDDRKRYNSEISYYLNSVILSNLAKKLGLSRDEVLYVDQELLTTYRIDEGAFRKKISERNDMLVEVTEDGVVTSCEGREKCLELLHSLDIRLDVDTSVREVKGQTAYRGKVVGKVRVLKTSHVDDFAEGDVLVTGMTTPDFAPLIKKSSAIVTNEGGITCHAAIVSREMKKPCVIGTKIATQVFKDGDMVEVDADSGIVKII